MARNYQKRNAKEYNILRGAFQWLTCSVFSIYYNLALNLKVEGRENVPKHTFFIVASNHVSGHDPFIIIHAIRKRIAYMAKIELFKNPIRRFFLNILGAFAVDRSRLTPSTVKTVLALKETGWAFGIFPQGKREKEGDMTIVNKGFAIFAKILKCAILPVAITGVEKDQRKFFKGNLKVKIGEPIPYNENVEEMIETWSKKIAQLMEDR